jgi:hypothetical protein
MMKPPASKIEYETSMGKQLLTAGLSAVMADFITFPLDTAKVRLQVSIRIIPHHFNQTMSPSFSDSS